MELELRNHVEQISNKLKSRRNYQGERRGTFEMENNGERIQKTYN